jgi:hypothetical protein
VVKITQPPPIATGKIRFSRNFRIYANDGFFMRKWQAGFLSVSAYNRLCNSNSVPFYEIEGHMTPFSESNGY